LSNGLPPRALPGRQPTNPHRAIRATSDMAQHDSKHHDAKHHEHGHEHGHGHKRKGLHKDWRAWPGGGLMLAPLAMYLLSDDEAYPPGGQPGQAMPAAPAPAPAAP